MFFEFVNCVVPLFAYYRNVISCCVTEKIKFDGGNLQVKLGSCVSLLKISVCGTFHHVSLRRTFDSKPGLLERVRNVQVSPEALVRKSHVSV